MARKRRTVTIRRIKHRGRRIRVRVVKVDGRIVRVKPLRRVKISRRVLIRKVRR